MQDEGKYVDLELDGRPYRLALDFNAMVEAEKASGENLLQGAFRLGPGASAAQVRGLLYALLKPWNPKVTLADAGELLTKNMVGTMRAMSLVFGNDADGEASENTGAVDDADKAPAE